MVGLVLSIAFAPVACDRLASATSEKKADVVEHPEVFDHVGLLVQRAPRLGRVALYLVVRRHPLRLLWEPAGQFAPAPLTPLLCRSRAKIARELFLSFGMMTSASSKPDDSELGRHRERSAIVRRGTTVIAIASEVTMKTQGEIEAAICEGITRFEQEYMGRGPKDIRAHLIDDLLVVRLQGVLTAAEQHLVKSLPAEKGRDLLKQVRTHLIETARPLMEAMVREITGIKVVSLHHDISTVTGEEVVLFTLADSPNVREVKKKSTA